MTDDNVISEYADAEAVDDGVLIPLAPAVGPVNRVTRAVFTHFVGQETAFRPVPLIETAKALEPLMAAIRAVLAVPPDRDGWRTGTWRDKTLWLVPNEIGGSTLMFPEDY